ncbi:MAG: hypothetical protein ACI8PT_002842 [Gammaproteobacteria bacterium]|jgi:hypothetical protein
MKWIVAALATFTLAAIVAWPYATLYRLDRALTEGDLKPLAEFVDVDAIRASVKERVGRTVNDTVGGQPGTVLGWIQEGVRQIGERAVDLAVDLEWVQDTLNASAGPVTDTAVLSGQPLSLLSRTSYAFHSGWDGFLVRTNSNVGEPLEIHFALQNWRWRVVAVYD